MLVFSDLVEKCGSFFRLFTWGRRLPISLTEPLLDVVLRLPAQIIELKSMGKKKLFLLGCQLAKLQLINESDEQSIELGVSVSLDRFLDPFSPELVFNFAARPIRSIRLQLG